MTGIEKIAVLGSGQMGHGIAQIAAQWGKYEVAMHDIQLGLIKRGMSNIQKSLANFNAKGQITRGEMSETLDRIKGTLDLNEAVSDADLIIEAVIENTCIKKSLFRKIDNLIPAETIVTTNTSSISITELATAIEQPQRFCGMHFFNPPQINRLVEVTKGARTAVKTIKTVTEVAKSMGKETVIVKKDCPGFIVNRILLSALNEAVEIFSTGIANRDDIDKAVKLGLNWPMGPLMLVDYIGADTIMAIAQVLEQKFGSKFHPSVGLNLMIQAQTLGKKTGKGFYDWPEKQGRTKARKEKQSA